MGFISEMYFLVDDVGEKFEFWRGEEKIAEIDGEGNLWLRGETVYNADRI